MDGIPIADRTNMRRKMTITTTTQMRAIQSSRGGRDPR
jgi:hypothetical protein